MGRKNLNRYSNMFLGSRMHDLLAMSVLGSFNDMLRFHRAVAIILHMART
jgi:hypothetical protein